jgi:hypothetical protein
MALKPFQLGIKAKMYFGEAGTAGVPTGELSNVTDVTITLDASEADVTTRDNDGFRATIAGLKECTIEFDMLYLPDISVVIIKKRLIFFFNSFSFPLYNPDLVE